MKPKINNAQADFAGKVVIITGAASGIGLATTNLFASRGALIVAEDINSDVTTVFADNDRIVPFVGDAATEEAAQNVVVEASKTLRNIRSVYIKEFSASVNGKKITSYRVNAKVTFEMERAG